MAKKRVTKSEGDQQYLAPDMEPPRVASIEKCAKAYSVANAEFSTARVEVTEQKQRLIALMSQNNLTTYRTKQGLVVTLKQGAEKLTVKADKTEDE